MRRFTKKDEERTEREKRSVQRKRLVGRAEIEKMIEDFPYVVVYWTKGKLKKREYCDLRRAAGILNIRIEDIHGNLRWNDGDWNNGNFLVQTVEVSKWLDEVAKQGR